MDIVTTPGAKMLYLIKRRPTTSRDELVMHWFKNHMPAVIKGNLDAKTAGRPHARRYIATLFDAYREGQYPWDGMAQLWWDKPLPRPDVPSARAPSGGTGATSVEYPRKGVRAPSLLPCRRGERLLVNPFLKDRCCTALHGVKKPPHGRWQIA